MDSKIASIEKDHKKYDSALEKSFKLSHDALTLLQDIKKDPQLDESKINKIDSLHKKLVLDNISLIRNKNEMKLKVADINERLVSEKIDKNDKQYNNTKLAALQRASTTNDSLAVRLSNIFHEIPELSGPQLELFLRDVKDPDDQQLLKRLFKGSPAKNDLAKNSPDEVVISESDVQKGKELFDTVSKQKSKLVLLNERYYNKKIRELEKSISYWDEQYKQVTDFIGGSMVQIKHKIDETQKRLDAESGSVGQSYNKLAGTKSQVKADSSKNEDVEMKDIGEISGN